MVRSCVKENYVQENQADKVTIFGIRRRKGIEKDVNEKSTVSFGELGEV